MDDIVFDVTFFKGKLVSKINLKKLQKALVQRCPNLFPWRIKTVFNVGPQAQVPLTELVFCVTLPNVHRY